MLQLTDEAALDNHLVLHGLSRLPQLPETPGHVFGYSNIGYVLVAEVLRHAPSPPTLPPWRTAGSSPRSGSPTPASLGPPPATVPHPALRTAADGGLWTTGRDLLVWLDALNRRLLGDELTGLLQTAGHLDDGTPLDHAWGMTARPASIGTIYTHGGSWPGWTAKTVRNLDAGTALALLTAHDDAHLVSDLAIGMHERMLAG